jgi:hypothetical protein
LPQWATRLSSRTAAPSKAAPNPFAAIRRRRSESCGSNSCVTEVDGDSHYTDRGEAYDASRTTALEAQGIPVIRVTNLEVMDQFEGVCLRITQELEKT